MRMILLFLCVSIFTSSGAQDSVIISASDQFKEPSWFRRLIVGKNYRDTWAMPVKMKIFFIDKEKGGLNITELGGGQQTKSLRMKDKDSIEWVLRTVDKDVEKAMPGFLAKTMAKKIVQDMVSGAHPYAPLTVAHLAKALKLSAPDPQLFYVPEDPSFGEYTKMFKDQVCMLERADPTIDNSDSKSTETLYEKLLEDQDNSVDDKMLLKARLLDMLIADWDRHQDQWKWGENKKGEGTLYYPIPRDRDQAFFLAKGLLVKMVRPFAMKHLVGFTDTDKKLKNLNFKSWSFDRTLLNQLDEEDWKKSISEFQSTLSDDVLKEAINKMPPEVVAKDGPEILEKLKKRRDELTEYGMKYYQFLSEKVAIAGTDKDDVVQISKAADDLTVTAFKKDGKTVRYKRTFKKAHTKEIKLELQAGEDQLVVANDVNSKIKLVLHGGKGKDSFTLNNALRVELDDESKTEVKK
jgi:hypothetical protein